MVTFLMPALRQIWSPTSMLPVKVILRTSREPVMASPISAPEPVMVWMASFGQAGFEQDFGEFEGRQRGIAGGLEDDGVAGGEGRADLVGKPG